MTSEPVIQVKSLTKRFGTLTAVNQVSFQVLPGEVFGILGPNGAGKTTLLECIEGLQIPTAGQAVVWGIDTRQEPDQVKEHIGVQLQASAYFDYLTLTEVLNLFGRFYRQRLTPDKLLAIVGLEDKAHSTVSRLSGGQKQRFTLAATLINDPQVLFLDEPTTGLDPQARRHLWEIVQQMHRDGRTVVLTTHYMEEAQFLCQRVAIMDQGKIIALDTPTNLIRQLPVPYRVRLVCDSPLPREEMKSLEAVQGVEHSPDGEYLLSSTEASRTLPALLNWLNGRGTTVKHLEVFTASLEDVFLTLTGKQLRE